MRLNYFPQLDGLRALAILWIVARHYVPGPMRWDPSGGRIGVDLFFVLSGFLITRSLLAAREQAGGSPWACLKAFYLRRTSRIVPAYYLTIAMAAVTGLERFGPSLGWHLTFLSNFYFIREGRYIGGSSQFWFIAVEQQFLLLWPLVLFWLPAARARLAVFGLIALGLLFRVIAGAAGWSLVTIDVMPPGGFECLGAGALLAVSGHGWIERIGLAGIVTWGARMAVAGLPIHPGASLVLTELSRGLILAWVAAKAAEGIPGWIGQALESRPARALGRYSYGIFLSHNFFFAAAHRRPWTTFGWPEPALVGVAFVLTLAWSALLYARVERPMIEITRRPLPSS